MAPRISDRIGDYEVIGELGAGGMARVYKVRNMISQQVAAMKIMLPDLANEASFAERFLREIQVLAALDHPGIARLHTALRVENQLVMVMELVEGVTLEDLLKQGRIPLNDGIDYICQVLSALSYAHRKGIIHRDIKPANMMRTLQGTIKLMDFGIAKTQLDSRLTRTGNIVGSLHYMSPEQVMGSSLDSRSDLYSVGVCLYEIATGVRPFQADSEYTLMELKIRREPPPPIQVDPSLPNALNEIILKALEKDPARRFQTAEEFWAALARLISAERAVRSTAGLKTQNDLFQASSIFAPAQVPSPLTTPSPPIAVTPPPEPIKRRVGLYIAVGAVLAVMLAGFLGYELLKPPSSQRQKPGGRKIEETSRQTANPLAPSLTFPSGDMVLVPGGEALLGSEKHTVSVPPFYIDRTAVTEGAYRAYCKETGHPLPPGNQEAASDLPVVNVTFDDAQQFAKWAEKRLPSAVEWEKAARGTDGRTYPWGNDLNFELANIPHDKAARKLAKLAPATAYPSGASPYGALNMLGNVWQWVDAPVKVDLEEAKAHFTLLQPPLSPNDRFYEVRGGSYYDAPNDPTSLIWDSVPTPARERLRTIGFRCARDANP